MSAVSTNPPLRVGQVVAGVGGESAGPSYSVPRLCSGLQQTGVNVTLYSLGKEAEPFPFPHRVYPSHRIPSYTLGRSPELFAALCNAAPALDILHSNALWMFPNIYPAWAIRGTPCKLVNSPRGSFAPHALRRSRWKKVPFWLLFQRAALAQTDLWHATCQKEYDEIRAMGYRQPVAIIPIGMDLPSFSPDIRKGASPLRQLVFFGRIHPIKAVDRLVAAWGLIASALPDWELVIAGPDCGGKAALDALIAAQRIPRVRFTGELHKQAKYDFLRTAELCVLPSFTENFGVTVAEALACETPVIASTGTPWSSLAAHQAGWWVDNAVASLKQTLEAALALPQADLLAMGKRGREWIAQDFSWPQIGAQMSAAYQWLLGRGSKPDCVITD